jgi:hypothetical protein
MQCAFSVFVLAKPACPLCLLVILPPNAHLTVFSFNIPGFSSQDHNYFPALAFTTKIQRFSSSSFPIAADSSVMEPDSIARTSHLERLPPELIRAILSQLSGLTALRCAILSCPLILNSFTGSSSVIATRVFLNELDSCDVRPEAMAALLASRLAKPTRSSAHEFYKAHLQKGNVEIGICLTLNEVADLSRLHSAASRLVKDFTEAILQKLVATMKDGHTFQPQSQPLEPSTLERHRIMRTLYILETFFNVFRQTSMPDVEPGQCMNDFLLNFADWEIEQIACVQDFLFFQVSPSTGAEISKV